MWHLQGSVPGQSKEGLKGSFVLGGQRTAVTGDVKRELQLQRRHPGREIYSRNEHESGFLKTLCLCAQPRMKGALSGGCTELCPKPRQVLDLGPLRRER